MMRTGLVILRPGDETALAQLSSRAEPGHGWSQASWRELLDQPSTLAVGLACGEDGLDGAIALSLTPEFADILNLLVRPDARRRGHARRLLHAALRHAGERGIARLCLDVSAANAPARALYAQLGFGEDGRRKAYYPGGDDAILMSRDVVDLTGLQSRVGPSVEHEPD